MAAHARVPCLDHIDHDGRVATVELRTFRNWPAPPPAAPAALKEMYAFLADRIARTRAI
jgi:hypothetical protein